MPHRILALALGIWIAIAPVMLVLPAAAVAMPMSMSDGSASGDCTGCPDAGMNRNLCAMMCSNILNFVLVPKQDIAGPVVFQFIDWPERNSQLTGLNTVPDPGPPRQV